MPDASRKPKPATPKGRRFANRAEWRAWLEKNHSTAKEVWLVLYKKHTGKTGLSFEEAVEEALCFGWIDGLLKPIDAEKYMLRYTPRRSGCTWSETNKRRAGKLVRQGLMTEAGLAKIAEAKRSGQWQRAAEREDPKALPPDLKRALAADKAARERFAKLAPSHRKRYLWWIAEGKREETRRRRIEETLRILREGKKPGGA